MIQKTLNQKFSVTLSPEQSSKEPFYLWANLKTLHSPHTYALAHKTDMSTTSTFKQPTKAQLTTFATK